MSVGPGFSVVLLVESRQKREQMVEILSKSCRDFKVISNVDDLLRRAHERPISVLIFGLASIEQSEVAYFRLLKTDPHIEQYIRSTLLLCDRNEVKQAFQLCRKGLFNDYYVAHPLYDPYHLLLRFKQLKALQDDGKMGVMKPSSISAVCDSLEQIAHADTQITGINTEMLQRLSETITLAMEALGKTVESQIGSGQGSAGELINRHSDDLVHRPIHSNVSEAIQRVKQVTAEAAEIAIDQRVSIGREHPEMPPRHKRVIVIEDNVNSLQELVLALEKNDCDSVCFSYGSDFAREADALSADIIMLDLTLPDMPAFHLIKKIKSSPSLSRAKLFVMAQPGDREKVELVIGMGVDEVIMKPIDEQMMAFKLSHY
ncbi:response regulator [Marinobacterium sp. D7]|uniref:response regulator n=1 Tax=Marinobacterium ramblicola TaxID=2849041 RepID=UPI001C2D9F44|nr:response regulator [Marinobacterium ramblicola]MBV1789282.1 response regulator [Marinobacterium ramblicola]